MKYIVSEFQKNKRRGFWWIVLALFGFTLLWFNISISMTSQGKDQVAKLAIYDMITVDNMIIPLLVALVASRITAPEQDNNMLKVLMTNGETPWQLFCAKLFVINLIVWMGVFFQIIIMYVITAKYKQSMPLQYLMAFVVAIVLSVGALSLVQLLLSLYIKNQSIPLFFGIAGSFVGLMTSGMIPKIITIFIPWQYVATLNPFVLVYRVGLRQTPNWWLLSTIVLVVIVAIFVVANHLISRKEKVMI